MADFKAPKLLQLEGGYTNHPERFKGGKRQQGHTYKTYKEYWSGEDHC